MQPIKLSVHKIIDMILRCGDIDSRFSDKAPSLMHKGSAAHRKIQKEMGENYQKEVPLKLELYIEDIAILLQGRADGIIIDSENSNSFTIDEIKSTTLPLDLFYRQHEQHLGQGMCYAYMYLQTLENPPESVAVQLTHHQLETEETKRYKWEFTQDELNSFFDDLICKYGMWLCFERDAKALRDETISKVTFPYKTYRKGQRELAVAVYRAVSSEKKLYASAPTGIGKTLSSLFPAIKALGEGKTEKLFYLTAKTITRTVAESAMKMMLEQGLRLKSITLRAKEKICTNDVFICSPEHCPYAKGHYDRINDAMLDMLENNDLITPAVTEEYARKHRVCPHELGLDAALWCDLVIGDYNHVFDLTVYLHRFFAAAGNYVFLIDEAHNLVDRVRDMYTASLSKAAFGRIHKQVKGKDAASKEMRKTLRQINAYMIDMRKELEPKQNHVEQEQDMVFKALVTLFSIAAGEWLSANKNSSNNLHDDILNLYFDVTKFLMISDIYDDHYTTIKEIAGSDTLITLFCLDPSKAVSDRLALGKSSIIFSATLAPLPYYREILGGDAEDWMFSLPSPFDPDHLLTIAHCGISTKYKDRDASYLPIADAVNTIACQRKGNYLVFFPSYEYMHKVHDIFCEKYPEINTLLQQNSLTEHEREEFLLEFDAGNSDTLIGFAVLGGIFSEGIDLKGDRLIGSVIVSVGIPKISLRQDQIRNYFDLKNGQGYDFAYVFPGMNKVLQAAGRVIRTETDSGIVLLIDSRYATAKYRELLPAHWSNMRMVWNAREFEAEIKNGCIDVNNSI